MIPNPFPGTYFAFEGIDGNGKTTLIEYFLKWLMSLRLFNVVNTKEPNKNGIYGKAIYADLANSNGLHVTNPKYFQSLYACDSRENLRDVVIPAISHPHTVVVSDRCRLSMVYGVETFKDLYELKRINQAILGEYFIWPDAIFILDVNVEMAMARLKRKGRQLDGLENAEKLERVRKLYELMVNPVPPAIPIDKDFPNCYLIHAQFEPELIMRRVSSIATNILIKRGQLSEAGA